MMCILLFLRNQTLSASEARIHGAGLTNAPYTGQIDHCFFSDSTVDADKLYNGTSYRRVGFIRLS